jgi:anti-anti-sigma factor
MHTVLAYTNPFRHQAVLGGWIAEAVGRGERVLVKHAPRVDAAEGLRRSLTRWGLDPDVAAAGQVELVDCARMYAESGGRAKDLLDLHLGEMRRARRDGFTGLAVTGDGPALRALTRDKRELIAHERDIDRLAANDPVRALCRYQLPDDAAVLDEVLAVHYRDVDDEIWRATVVDEVLRVRGEIDASNADRFATVVCSAAANGVSRIDLSEVEFFAAAGAHALAVAADRLHERGERLILVDPGDRLTRLLTATLVADHPAVRLAPGGAGS